MIPQITIGAASLMGSLVAATAAVRWAVAPTAARNRQQAAFGAAAPQQLVHCPACHATTAATVHGIALLCADGHLLTNPDIEAGLDRLQAVVREHQKGERA